MSYLTTISNLAKLVKNNKKFTGAQMAQLTRIENMVNSGKKNQITNEKHIQYIKAIRDYAGFASGGSNVSAPMTFDRLAALYADKETWNKIPDGEKRNPRPGYLSAATRHANKLAKNGKTAEANKLAALVAKIKQDQEQERNRVTEAGLDFLLA